MTTSVLQNTAPLQQEVNNTRDDEDTEDVHCDSIRYDTPAVLDLHKALIDIDEEIGEEEIEGLKFLCRDHISVAKLGKAESGLEIFDMMKKQVLIADNNFDYLLECLGRVHRVDLVRKLGFQPEAVREHLPHFQKLLPYRTLLMDITEELDDHETEKVRFFLRGKIRKKALNEKSSLLQLLVFMEQEGLLAHNNLDLLTKVMESIRRGDLVDMIREYQGLPPLQRHNPGIQRNASIVVPSQHERQLGPGQNERLPPQEPNQQRQGLVQSASGGNISSQDRQIERSVSAGTLSVNSEENVDVPNRKVIPEPLLQQIANDLYPHVNDMGMELGLTNPQLIAYSQQVPDEKERTVKILQDWQTATIDKGSIAPALHYVLGKLGCKNAATTLKQWIDSFNTSQAQAQTRQSLSDFEPAGPPDENVCVSYRTAQVGGTPVDPVPQQITENVQVLTDLQQVNVNPNQLQDQRCVTYVNGMAVYKQGDQFVANSGISQPLQPVVLPVAGQGQGQMMPVMPEVKVPVRRTETLGAPLLQSYNMDRKPRGWCVILNNEKFYVDQNDRNGQSKEMPPRNGTERDAATLQVVFEKLGFIVRRHDNLTDTQMMNVLIDAAHNVDHTIFDCFVCCILTHGVLGHLYGSNGRLVSIKDLTSTFQTNRCATLAGKPKLFFLQACQGRDKMEGGEIERDGPNVVPDTNGDIQHDGPKEMIPNEADFLLGYATVPGYVSFRSRNHGSWYIRKLCELLDKYAGSYDLMSILVEVNNQVAAANASMDGSLYKQIPAPLVTLRKRIYFR